MLLDLEKILLKAKATASIAGIYFLIKSEQIVYVGQSKNVYARLAAHVVSKEFDYFHVLPCPVHDLLTLEALYIQKFNPPLNIKRPTPRELETSYQFNGDVF